MADENETKIRDAAGPDGTESPAKSPVNVHDTSTSTLANQIDALLHLDARGVLTPHGVGGLARELFTRSRNRMVVSDQMVARACAAHRDNRAAHDEWVSEQGMRAALKPPWRNNDGRVRCSRPDRHSPGPLPRAWQSKGVGERPRPKPAYVNDVLQGRREISDNFAALLGFERRVIFFDVQDVAREDGPAQRCRLNPLHQQEREI